MSALPRLILAENQRYTIDGLQFRYLWLSRFLGTACTCPIPSGRVMSLIVELVPYGVPQGSTDLLVFDEGRKKTIEIPDLPAYLESSPLVGLAFLTYPFFQTIAAAIKDKVPEWDSVSVEVLE